MEDGDQDGDGVDSTGVGVWEGLANGETREANQQPMFLSRVRVSVSNGTNG